MASNVNETVCMDLKISQKHGIIILYIIDMYSRFTVGVIIPDKRPEGVVDAFLDKWVLNLFGAPKRLLTDSGGEFHNRKLKDMCENFNIKMITSGAYSPFQNGLCESNHKLVDVMMEKMLQDDPNMPLTRALSQAILAKNMLVNHNGFSPLQLVTGQQPRLPSAMDNSPPAKESVSAVQNVRNRINEIFSARKAFTQAENSKKLNSALQVKSIPKYEHYSMGEEVFYKHGKNPHWMGPAKIIGLDGKVVIIRQGRFILSTSQTRLLKVHQTEPVNLNPKSKNLNVQDSSQSEEFPPVVPDDESSDEEDEPIREEEADNHAEEANEGEDSEDHVGGEQVDGDQLAGEGAESDGSLDRSGSSLDSSMHRQADSSVSSFDEDEDIVGKHLEELIEIRENMDANPKTKPKIGQKVILRRIDGVDDQWKV